MMHIKVPFLAVLFLSIFQLAIYGIENNNYSKKELDEILAVNQDNVSEIQIRDLSSQTYHIKDPEQIGIIVDYFNQFQYQRLRNDQTSFMPSKTMMIRLDDNSATDFIIPYGSEVMISHKVYRIKNGAIEQEDLQKVFGLLPDKVN